MWLTCAGTAPPLDLPDVLAILVSVPHGGTETPVEVADRVILSKRDLFEDGDAFTREIYDVGDDVARFQSADIARAFVDLNRAPDDRPPANPDGVVKSATCYDVPIYRGNLTAQLADELLEKYHAPYHVSLEDAGRDPNLRLALDCHSMAAAPPNVAPDSRVPRPLFCLSNGDGETCPPEVLGNLADAVAAAFEIDRGDVSLNTPFKGGYITRRHGSGPLPWIQVEMNRSLYLAGPWFDRGKLTIHPGRTAELRDRFLSALRSFDL